MRRLVLCALMAAVMAVAAEVSGNWTGEAIRSDGTWVTDVFLMLKDDAGKLTGSIGTNPGEQVPLSNGKVDGDNVTFDVVTDEGTYKVALVIAGNAITGKAVRQEGGQEGPPLKIQLKRSN